MSRLTITRSRQRIPRSRTVVRYHSKDVPGAGFVFACTADGVPLGDDYATQEQRCEQIAAIEAEGRHLPGIIDTDAWTELQTAAGRCQCGSEVDLFDPLDNECPGCHRWYNALGQEVVNPDTELGRALRAEDDRFAEAP